MQPAGWGLRSCAAVGELAGGLTQSGVQGTRVARRRTRLRGLLSWRGGPGAGGGSSSSSSRCR